MKEIKFPVRKRVLPISQEEFNFYLSECEDEETRRTMLSGKYFEKELDIPEVDILESKIKNDYSSNKLNGKPIDLLKKYYKDIDDFNRIFKNYKPCKKGCSYCCYIPVSISILEINIIEQYLNKNNIRDCK
jgi:hypothetical protein